LAVYAPSSATSESNLPVFVFIQGGGFNSNANPNLNGTGLIEASGNNIIIVTFNYRVGPWGFLAAASSAEGKPVANNGLRDQRKALEWVQKYITAFGGDPNHVVIGGDSAGAASVALQLSAYGGRNDNLFHAAAAESVSFATVLTPAESQYQYNNFTRAVGCDKADPSTSLACLRSKSAAELEAQNFNIPSPGQTEPPLYMFNPTLDGDIITDLTYTAFAQGKFIDVPVIIGDDTNGGTVFTPRNTSTVEESNDFLTEQFPYLTPAQLAAIDSLYPNANQSACPAPGCWWRQVSDAYGDTRYMCPGLYISSAYANVSSSSSSPWSPWPRSIGGGGGSLRARKSASASGSGSTAKSYAYRYNVEDPAQVAQGLGVPHTVELNAIFGPSNVPAGSAPDSYYPGESNAHVVPVIQAYWTSFIRTFDPNTYKLDGAVRWEEYYGPGYGGGHGSGEEQGPQRLVFNTGGVTVMEQVDAEQRVQCAYLQSIGVSIKQ